MVIGTLGTAYAKTTWTCEYYKKNNKLGDITWTLDSKKITFEDSNYNPTNYTNNNGAITLSNNNPDNFLSDMLSIKNTFNLLPTTQTQLGSQIIKFSNQAAGQNYHVNYNLSLRKDGGLDSLAFVFSNNSEQRTYVIKNKYVHPLARYSNSDEGFVEENVTDKTRNYASVRKQFNLRNCNPTIS